MLNIIITATELESRGKKKTTVDPHSSFTGAGSSGVVERAGRIEPATMMTGATGLLASQGPVIVIETGIGIHEGSQSTAAKLCAFASDRRAYFTYCLRNTPTCRITHTVT